MEFQKIRKANQIIMHKLGSIVGNDKSSFADLLESADVVVSNQDTISDMVEKYINELPENDNLKVLTAYFVEDENAQNFDGQIENDNVYENYNAIYNYWDYDYPENYFNFDPVTAIATAVGEGAKLGGKIAEGKQKKKYGLQDLASKKQDAKAQLVQAIVQQKQAEAEKQKQESESKAKKNKYWIIGGSVVGGLAVIGLIIYLVKKRNG